MKNILICGGASIGLSHALAQFHKIDALKSELGYNRVKPDPINLKIPKGYFDKPFTQPTTRAERRAKERKLKK